MDIPTIERLEQRERERLQALKAQPIQVNKSLTTVLHRGLFVDAADRDSMSYTYWQKMDALLNNWRNEVLVPALDAHQKLMQQSSTDLAQLAAEKKRKQEELYHEAKSDFDARVGEQEAKKTKYIELK